MKRMSIIVVEMLLMCVVSMPLFGQTAPAGNAHPESRRLSETAGDNPFGVPSPTACDAARKHVFSEQVDLEPLKGLAVFHDGRVKVIETLANETVKGITGRGKYIDYIRSEGSDRAKAVSYAPTFTFFDLIIDPLYYEDKALIGVGFLPLREALLEKKFKDPAEIEWWKRQAKLSPAILRDVADEVSAEYEFEEPYRRGLNAVRESASWYLNGWKNLLLVAPQSVDKSWQHLSELEADSAAGHAVQDLGRAWRACDADAVNKAIAVLAAELPKMNSPLYPTWRRSLERTYYATRPFEYGYWLYAVSLLSLLLSFGTGRRWLLATGLTALAGAMLMHGGGFFARCVIAERFAIQNQFESMTGVSLFAAFVGTTLMVVRRQWLFGAAAAAVGFMVLIMATQAPIIPGMSIEREAAILNTSVLLKYHVTTVLVSYGLIALGFVTSLFYLGAYYLGGATAGGTAQVAIAGGQGGMATVALGLGEGEARGPKRVLAELDSAQMIILQLAFWCLGVGILLGAWWADHSWGRWWAFDPKELWALITWIIYLIVIHIRFGISGQRRAVMTAWLSVLGFIVMLWTYFGVNLLLPGLHAYA